MALAVVDKNNKKVRDLDVKDLTAEKVNKAVLYYALKASRNNKRHGTAAVKNRADIAKTTKKMCRQKGTGGARHGARSASIFVGGNSSHGPTPRSYYEYLSKTFKKKSYHEVFKYLIQNDLLKVVSEFKFAKPSTKEAAKVLAGMKVKKALVVLPQDDKASELSFRNIRDVKVVHDNNLSVYDLLRYENIILTESCFAQVKERYAL